jgi:integrative and conjugative element protein (TIGR02256 family)
MIDVELTFKDENGHLIVIMPTVVKRLFAHRQLSWNSNEAAGVLIGERRGPHIVIHEISEPGVGDIRSRHSVDRCGSHHQLIVDEAFLRSSGTLQYLGEWHTHPEDTPFPSTKDLNSWGKYLIDSEHMLLLIVGRKNVWAAKKITNTIVLLLEN